MKTELKIDWASHEAAKFACENWHYSQCLPVGKLVKVGAWENGKFIGVVLFGRGANNNMLKTFKLDMDEGCELVRIALNKHKSPVSRIVKIAINFLKKQSPRLRLIVSYADSGQNHHGGIYQAGNWIFDHESKAESVIIDGKKYHKKTVHSKYGYNSVKRLQENGINAIPVKDAIKYRYIMPLDKQMRKKVEHLAKPYPKRGLVEEQQIPSADGGATPTSTLQIQEAD